MAMRSRALVPSTASTVMVKITGRAQGTLQGILYSPYVRRQSAFADVLEFAAKLDRLFDEIDFPMAATAYRAFRQKRKKPLAMDEKREEHPVAEGHFDKTQLNAGDSGTFVVHVKFRRNATWQGTVKWAGENQEQHFRSTLELLKIMDSALADSVPEED